MIIDSNLPSCISPEHFKFCHREIKKAIQQAGNLQAGGKLSYSYWMLKQKVIAVGDGFPQKSVISPCRQRRQNMWPPTAGVMSVKNTQPSDQLFRSETLSRG